MGSVVAHFVIMGLRGCGGFSGLWAMGLLGSSEAWGSYLLLACRVCAACALFGVVLILWVLGCSSPALITYDCKSECVRQLVREFVYTMFITNKGTLFHLRCRENLVKHQVSKYYENDFRISFMNI